METHDDTPAPPPACDGCGRDSDAEIGGHHWCADCLHERGSCCSGE